MDVIRAPPNEIGLKCCPYNVRTYRVYERPACSEWSSGRVQTPMGCDVRPAPVHKDSEGTHTRSLHDDERPQPDMRWVLDVESHRYQASKSASREATPAWLV